MDARATAAAPPPPPPPRFAALALGASLGDRRAALELAVRALDAHPGIEVLRTTAIVETPAHGGVARAPFLEAMALVRTALSAGALAQFAREIERRAGRRPARRWADRVLDVDLVLMQGEHGEGGVLAEAGIQVPHPRLPERETWLSHLALLWPSAKNPWCGLRYTEVLPTRPRWTIIGALPQPAPLHGARGEVVGPPSRDRS
jgi:2-amino-4-hydroxy-6-hydroxymethyldihydropteridine diphosphokinase